MVVIDGGNISGEDTATGTAYTKALRLMTRAYLLTPVLRSLFSSRSDFVNR